MRDKMLSLAMFAVAVAIAFHAVAPARAEGPGPAPVCAKFKGSMVGGFSPDEVSAWMAQQQAAGRSSFFAPATYPTWGMVCAY